MPWDKQDASRFTKKAKAASVKEKWSKVANAVMRKTGDEARAIKTANAVIKKARGRPRGK